MTVMMVILLIKYSYNLQELTIMGSAFCSEQQQSTLQTNTNLFMDSIKYYASQLDPVTNTEIEVYSYKEIFIQKKTYALQAKDSVIKLSQFFTICSKCPAGAQSILELSSVRDVGCGGNYGVSVFGEHLNYNLSQHLNGMRFKGVSLSIKEIYYILRELVRAGVYFAKRGYRVRSFDSSDLYLSSAFQIKIPFQNIIHCRALDPQLQPLLSPYNSARQVLFLAPQQLNPNSRNRQPPALTHRNVDPYRIFSLGILILECSTMLDAVVTYYNYQKKEINMEKVRHDINSLKDKRLAKILESMLTVDPKKRVRYRDIEEILDKMDQSEFQQYLLID